MRRTGRSRQSDLESRPRWGVSERLKSTPRSATLPRMANKKSRAPAPPPPSESTAKVGRSAMSTSMATFHQPRRKFHIPCKGRSVLTVEDDEVYYHRQPTRPLLLACRKWSQPFPLFFNFFCAFLFIKKKYRQFKTSRQQRPNVHYVSASAIYFHFFLSLSALLGFQITGDRISPKRTYKQQKQAKKIPRTKRLNG